ncbi:sulfur carrier protein ThiS [Salmonella enterica]
MQIRFNDECLDCPPRMSVAALLSQLHQLKPGVALAINGQILPREQWDESLVQDGDSILLFQVIAGG